jgi:ABC-2 type transport system ATP-binding protein
MIEVRDLSRRYGDFWAVQGVSFAVEEGEIVGILGPNGAGKTTTIRMITGFLPPTRGQVQVAGRDLLAEPREARRNLGYLPENISLYPEMRVEEYLSYRARLEGMGRPQERIAIPEILARCLLEDVRRQIIGTLSKGYRQRVGLATAILHGPRVLVLDEPTVGLDPKQIIAIRDLIRELGQDRTLLLSTHILPEVELLCNRIVIIDRGRIAAQGTPDSLRQSWQGRTVVRLEIAGAPAEAREVLERVPGVKGAEAEAEPGSWAVECESGTDPRADLFRAAVERGWVLLRIEPTRATLEELFVRLTTRDAALEAEAPPGADPAAGGGPEDGAEAPAAADGGEEARP